MIFSSYKFIFLFFPIVYLGYFLLKKTNKYEAVKLWLIAASLYFYGSGNIKFLPILVFTALFNFVISRGIVTSDKKPVKTVLMSLGILENLGMLFYFKYRNFFFQNINWVFGSDIAMKNIILPLGISFYTFQILSYVFDCYNGDAKKYGFTDYMLFVTFFPQLIVGPVVTHGEIIPQFKKDNLLKIDKNNILAAIMYFSIGCAKKILLADPLIDFATAFYGGDMEMNFITSWTAVLSYTFAYYFDFSGYIDMALGLGLFFNIKLPVNFNSPYKARNFADFWRRWNITISRFLNDNIFKNIFKFGDGMAKLIFATLITFIVSGIWHGAGWHYIAWGVVNGIFVSIANVMTVKRKKLPFPLAWALTFFFSVLVRVLFDATGLFQAAAVYKTMFTFNDGILYGIRTFAAENIKVLCVIGISAFICFFCKNTQEMLADFKPKPIHAVFCGVILAVSLFYIGSVSQFLYFQF